MHIAQPRKEKDINKAPDFVYNVMGSSAGAGSGEFHVYRQLRRKEYERQRVLESRKSKEDLDEAFQMGYTYSPQSSDLTDFKKHLTAGSLSVTLPSDGSYAWKPITEHLNDDSAK